MPYCTSCGAEVKENAHFCERCGRATEQVLSAQAQKVVDQAVTHMVFGRIMAGLSMANGIVSTVMGFGFGMLAAGVTDTQPSMPIVALFFAVQPCLALLFAFLAKRRGCTNKMAKTGVILGALAFVIYLIAVPVLFLRLLFV